MAPSGVSAWSSCGSPISGDAPCVLGRRGRSGGGRNQPTAPTPAEPPSKAQTNTESGAANRHNNSRVSETKRLVKQAACRLIAALSHLKSLLRQKFLWSEDKVGRVARRIVPERWGGKKTFQCIKQQQSGIKWLRLGGNDSPPLTQTSKPAREQCVDFCQVSHNPTPLAAAATLPHCEALMMVVTDWNIIYNVFFFFFLIVNVCS